MHAHALRLPRRRSQPHRATPSARSGCWSTAACCCARPPRLPSRRSRSSRAPWRAWRARSLCARCAPVPPPQRQVRGQTSQGRGPCHVRRLAARRGAVGARPPWLPPRAAAAGRAPTRAPGPDAGGPGARRGGRRMAALPGRPAQPGAPAVRGRGGHPAHDRAPGAGHPLPGGLPRPAVPGLRVSSSRVSRRAARCVPAAVLLAAEIGRPRAVNARMVAGCST